MITKITDDFYIDINEVVTLSEHKDKCYVWFKGSSPIEFARDRFLAIKERVDIFLNKNKNQDAEKLDDLLKNNQLLLEEAAQDNLALRRKNEQLRSLIMRHEAEEARAGMSFCKKCGSKCTNIFF